jgi:hypothetical protein
MINEQGAQLLISMFKEAIHAETDYRSKYPGCIALEPTLVECGGFGGG